MRFQYVGERYKEYFATEWWGQLKETHIFSDPAARCWICETPVYVFWKDNKKTSNLLLHHEIYDNLFNEVIGRDLFILCYNCHTQLHFHEFLKFLKWKTKLIPRDLRRRRYFLRYIFLTHKQRHGLASWYFLCYLFKQ